MNRPGELPNVPLPLPNTREPERRENPGALPDIAVPNRPGGTGLPDLSYRQPGGGRDIRDIDLTDVYSGIRRDTGGRDSHISYPNDVSGYRSNRPPEVYDRYRDIWEESRSHPNPKRFFWREYVRREPRTRVVYVPRYSWSPVYHYSPWSVNFGFYYWGYDNCYYDPFRRSRVTVIYAPPATYRETNTYYYPTSSSSTVTYTASSTAREEHWPGWRDQQDEVAQAAEDIRNAWLDRRADLIERHVDDTLPVRFYENGQYRYWLSVNQFLERIAEEMSLGYTRQFAVDRIVPVRPGEFMVFARHELQDSAVQNPTRYERYTMEKLDREWVISAFETHYLPLLEQ